MGRLHVDGSPDKRLSEHTAAVIRAVEASAQATLAVSDAVARELAEHSRRDEERFGRLTTLVESIASDTKSLLASRSFTRGAWRAVAAVSAAISTAIGLAIAYWRG